jgi:hypothetical protein
MGLTVRANGLRLASFFVSLGKIHRKLSFPANYCYTAQDYSFYKLSYGHGRLFLSKN